MKNKYIVSRLYKKACKSSCRFKISAIAISHKGDVLGVSNNQHRFVKHGGGIHSEMRLMAQYGKNIKTIFILRVGLSGNILPIEPCEVCARKAEELGIKIMNIDNV